MPIIMCVYCEYIGQGENWSEKMKDVREHEKICKWRSK